MHRLMTYIDSPGGEDKNFAKGTRKYTGDVAKGYDKKRETSQKWVVEQQIIERMLSDFPPGSWIVDAPCGTGRFFQFYEKQRFIVRGIDISPDMLRVAGNKIQNPTAIIDDEKAWGWRVSNLVEDGTGLEESSVDAAVCCRFTRWAFGQHGERGVIDVLKELQRVARSAVIFTARVKDHPMACTYDVIEKAIQPGWAVHEDAEGYMDAYRIIKLGPAA